MSSPASIEPGQVLHGRYEITSKIGRGAFATVWLASDLRRQGLPVALKVLDPRSPSRGWREQRFAEEAKLTSKLKHDAIAQNLDHFVAEPWRVLVFEYVEGDPLRVEMGRRAKAGRRFELAEVGRVMDALLDGLDYAHQVGVVHRDLKPANLMLRSLSGNASSAITILDFGVAKALEREVAEATTVGRHMGTALYMAPEQVNAARDLDARADIFAAGVLAFELLSLRTPWLRANGGALPRFSSDPIPIDQHNTLRSIMSRIAQGNRPRLEEVQPDLPKATVAAVERAMAVAPNDRFASAAEMRGALVESLGVAPKWKSYLIPPRIIDDNIPFDLAPTPVVAHVARENDYLPTLRQVLAASRDPAEAPERAPTQAGWGVFRRDPRPRLRRAIASVPGCAAEGEGFVVTVEGRELRLAVLEAGSIEVTHPLPKILTYALRGLLTIDAALNLAPLTNFIDDNIGPAQQGEALEWRTALEQAGCDKIQLSTTQMAADLRLAAAESEESLSQLIERAARALWALTNYLESIAETGRG